MSTISKFVTEGKRGAKNPQNHVDVVYRCPKGENGGKTSTPIKADEVKPPGIIFCTHKNHITTYFDVFFGHNTSKIEFSL